MLTHCLRMEMNLITVTQFLIFVYRLLLVVLYSPLVPRISQVTLALPRNKSNQARIIDDCIPINIAVTPSNGIRICSRFVINPIRPTE